MHPRKPTLLYLFPRPTVFVQRDLDMLAADFTVQQHALLRGPKVLLPFRLLAQLWFLILHKAWRHDIICHFAGYHSVLPTLMGRRCFIILAGSDGACFPSIRYGNFRKAIYGRATAFSVRHATCMLPVDDTLIGSEQDYDSASPRHQGVKAHVPGLRTPWKVVHYGFDTSYWTPDDSQHRDPLLFVCAASGAVPGSAVHFRKGVDLIIAAAELVPQARIVIAGSAAPEAYVELPPNVTVLGRLDGDAMRQLYRSAAFYMQPSMMEGFPNALCEAMLCGCVPLVSNVAAMPGIVGRIGHILIERNAHMLAELMRKAMHEPKVEVERRSHEARSHVVEKYPVQHRRELLLDVLARGWEQGQ